MRQRLIWLKNLSRLQAGRLVFDQAHDFERLQRQQLAANCVAGLKDFCGHGFCIHARADTGGGAGVEQADALGVQVFGEEDCARLHRRK